MGSPSSVAEPERLALSVGNAIVTAEPALATGAAFVGAGGGVGVTGGGGDVCAGVLLSPPPPPPQAASRLLASAAEDHTAKVRALMLARSVLMLLIPFS